MYFALQSSVTVKNFCTVKLNSISVSPPSAYKQLSSNSSRTGKNRMAGPKTLVYTGVRVASLEDFSPKKEI
jgi:hypothetical protein